MNDNDLRKLIKTAGSKYRLDSRKSKLLLNKILATLRKFFKSYNHDIPKLKE